MSRLRELYSMTIRESIDFQFMNVNIDQASKREIENLHEARGLAMRIMMIEAIRKQKEKK